MKTITNIIKWVEVKYDSQNIWLNKHTNIVKNYSQLNKMHKHMSSQTWLSLNHIFFATFKLNVLFFLIHLVLFVYFEFYKLSKNKNWCKYFITIFILIDVRFYIFRYFED